MAEAHPSHGRRASDVGPLSTFELVDEARWIKLLDVPFDFSPAGRMAAYDELVNGAAETKPEPGA